MPLNNKLNIFRTLIKSRRSLQFFRLRFIKIIKFFSFVLIRHSYLLIKIIDLLFYHIEITFKIMMSFQYWKQLIFIFIIMFKIFIIQICILRINCHFINLLILSFIPALINVLVYFLWLWYLFILIFWIIRNYILSQLINLFELLKSLK